MNAPADVLRRRRRILAWSSPALALCLVGGSTLLLGCGAAEVTRTAFVVGQSRTAARAAELLGLVDLVEPWKAPFDAGTVAASRARTEPEWRTAERLLREALRSAPPQAQCAVRVNLSAVLEALGDLHADDPAAAAADYAAARDVARDAPAGCVDEPSAAQAQRDAEDAAGQGSDDEAGKDGSGKDGSGGRSAADDLADATQRTETKATAAAGRAGNGSPSGEASPAGEPSERDQELAQRTQQAQQDSPGTGGAGDGAGAGDGVVDVPSPW
ncbi:hypothetical protein Cch01nite_06140 [Cellulomonas chitinilytica]|uniref:Uncharacterized protein n=1 Tax=Cellulomonas chitinilytica TaxID=398759 RepID=A0A919P0B2_9CELL|nr:hypothetical protein [Cellulomonas chitinilytica]GIG19890.1 hypothetical protein Cch01nite_06140 [Cellulomonas chitinilytica]